MTNYTYKISLRDRNILRAQRYECLENFHAQFLAETGDIELFEDEFELVAEFFPYPNQKMGKQKISGFEFTDQGMARFDALFAENAGTHEAYQNSCVNPLRKPVMLLVTQQIRYTTQGIYNALSGGKRDILLVSNKSVKKLSFPDARLIAIDPDTHDDLLTDDEILDLDEVHEDRLAQFYIKTLQARS